MYVSEKGFSVAELFQIDIEKNLGNEYWTNVYHVWAESLAVAVTASAQITAKEQLFHYNVVSFVKARVRTKQTGDDIFSNYPIGAVGSVSLSTNQLLPLFNTVRVDWPTAQGRPSRKYYRGCLAEAYADADFTINSTLVTLVNNSLAPLCTKTVAVDGYFLCDVDGQAILSAVTQKPVQMRQLRRSRRKRTQPVF